jgi:hypothetical protein
MKSFIIKANYKQHEDDFFLDVVPCSLVEVYRHFRVASCLHHHPDDAGSQHL